MFIITDPGLSNLNRRCIALKPRITAGGFADGAGIFASIKPANK